jgi:hypothetical protein
MRRATRRAAYQHSCESFASRQSTQRTASTASHLERAVHADTGCHRVAKRACGFYAIVARERSRFVRIGVVAGTSHAHSSLLAGSCDVAAVDCSMSKIAAATRIAYNVWGTPRRSIYMQHATHVPCCFCASGAFVASPRKNFQALMSGAKGLARMHPIRFRVQQFRNP